MTKIGRRGTFTSAAGAALIAAIVAVGCSGSTSTNPAPANPKTANSTATSTTVTDPIATTSPDATTVALPATAAGDQLGWVLGEAPTASDDEFTKRFDPAFFAQSSVDALRKQIGAARITKVVEIMSSTPTSLVVLADSGSGRLAISITVDSSNRIVGLKAQPGELPRPPSSWSDVQERLDAAAPRTAYLAAEVTSDSTITPVHAARSDAAVPLGSSFKLFVLGAVVRAIEDGRLEWDRPLTITDAIKSLPSGDLQNRAVGSTVTVREAAEKMIQISDNTAADLLASTVGHDALEQMLPVMGVGEASRQRMLPFLTTRQLFTLKWGDDKGLVPRYATASTADRRALLAQMSDVLPNASALNDQVPIAIDSIEWFATPSEIVAAHAWLDAYRQRPGYEALDAILGTNPGVPVNPAAWSSLAFKGGSEPGVVFLGWFLHRADGRTFSVVVSVVDTTGPVDEFEAASIGQGIIELLATQS